MSYRHRNYWNNEPIEIKAKFESNCAETGKVIKKGDSCLYYPACKKVYCDSSKTYQDYFSMRFDEECLINRSL